jgi:integrase
MARLTRTFVEGLAARDRTFIEWDDDLPGFGVRVTTTGNKSWVVQYRAAGGGRAAPTRRMTRGSLATLTSEQARGGAKDILATVRLGGDPANDIAKGREAPTIKELSPKFLRADAKVGRKASTLALYTLYFKTHILPAIGSKRAKDVTDADLRKLHRQIGIDAGKPSTANRVVATLSGFFAWGIKAREIDRTDNPARTVDRFKETSRERFLTTDELARLGAALREAETIGLPHLVDESKPSSKHARKPENRRTIIDQHSAAAIRLLILTGARLREILHLRWTSVDLERGMLFLDDSKTGRKPVLLNAPAVQILNALPRVGQFVIAGRSAGTDDEAPRADLHRPWRAITKRAALEGLRIHDLRHTHASVGAGAGVGLPIIGALLGHADAATTAKYAHLANDPVRRASERIGGDIAAAMGEAPPPAPDSDVVVPFGRARQ